MSEVFAEEEGLHVIGSDLFANGPPANARGAALAQSDA